MICVINFYDHVGDKFYKNVAQSYDNQLDSFDYCCFESCCYNYLNVVDNVDLLVIDSFVRLYNYRDVVQHQQQLDFRFPNHLMLAHVLI